MLTTRGAVLRTSPGKLEVVDLELEEPQRGELLIRMVAAGLCHSDDHAQAGDLVPDHLPMVCGHEGAGIVEAVGPHTAGYDVGDHVVFSFIPSCGRCRWCAEGLSNLCDMGKYQVRGCRTTDPDSFRFRLDGEPTGQMGGLGTFAEMTVIEAASAIKVDRALPLDILCLLGCGVGTGWGAAVYAGEVMPGDVVIVMGIGGIGINSVQGAVHAGATTVIAVDPVEFKRESAIAFGATHAFSSIDEATDFARSITNGQGADKTIVAVGVTTGKHVAEAVESIRKAGTAVVVGMGSPDSGGIPVEPRELAFMQKRIQGALYGGGNPVADIPRQIRMYETGQLKLDELVTRRYRLDDIAVGYNDLHAGLNIRGIITYE